jgi:flagellar biosynthesis protein FlhB
MAERDDAQERTEQPSAKRLQDAREKGQLARSRELTRQSFLLRSRTDSVAEFRPVAPGNFLGSHHPAARA